MQVRHRLEITSGVLDKNAESELIQPLSWLPVLVLSLLFFVSSCGATPSKSELDADVKWLCGTDGGVKVYETVTLPGSHFDKNGRPNIRSKKSAKPGDEYYYEWEVQILRPGKPDDGTGEAIVWRDDIKYYRSKDSKLLGEDISYVRRGGDIPGLGHPSSFRCPSIPQNPSAEMLIFLKRDSSVPTFSR